MILFANRSLDELIFWMVDVATERSFWSVVVVRMCKIRCCTLRRVVRKEGNDESTFKARALA